MVTTIKVKAAEHPIKSVTIFKSRKAEIVRTFSLSLKAGQNQIEITGLPSVIDTESSRVTGLGDARLFDVVCSINRQSSLVTLGDSELEGVRILEAQKEDLELEKSIVQEQATVLSEYAKSLKGEHVSTQDMGAFVQNFVAQKKESLKASSDLKERILALERQIAKERERLAAKKGKAEAKVSAVIFTQSDGPVKLVLTYIVSNAQWEPTYDLHATTDNGKPSTSVSLHYRARITQTTGEDWKDTALILSTTATEIMMGGIPPLQTCNLYVSDSYRYPATTVFQQQQQPSNNTNINVFARFGQAPSNNFGQPAGSAFQQSTGAPLQQSIIPFGGAAQQQQQQQQAPVGGLFGSAQPATSSGTFGSAGTQQPQASTGSLFGSAAPAPSAFGAPPTGFGAFGAATNPPPADNQPAPGESDADEEWVSGADPELQIPAVTENLAVVNKSPLSISYAVEGLSSIPTDGELHKVSVAVLPFEADVTCITMPRQKAVAYMQSSVKNTSDFRLLPGPVAVFLDNSYVSKTSISDINSGDTFQCTFGVDTSTRISYTRTSKTIRDPNSAFSEQFKTTTLTSTTKISNQHSFPVSIVSKDTIPLCLDRRVKVILKKPVGLVDAKSNTVDLKREDGFKVRWGKPLDDKGGEKDGKFEWIGTVAAGKEISLVTEWEVKCPVDVTWNE